MRNGHTYHTGGKTAGFLCAERLSDKKEFLLISASGDGFVRGSANGKVEEMKMDDVRIYRKMDGVEV